MVLLCLYLLNWLVEKYLKFLRFSESVEDKNCNEGGYEKQDPHQNGCYQLQLKLCAETEENIYTSSWDNIWVKTTNDSEIILSHGGTNASQTIEFEGLMEARSKWSWADYQDDEVMR